MPGLPADHDDAGEQRAEGHLQTGQGKPSPAQLLAEWTAVEGHRCEDAQEARRVRGPRGATRGGREVGPVPDSTPATANPTTLVSGNSSSGTASQPSRLSPVRARATRDEWASGATDRPPVDGRRNQITAAGSIVAASSPVTTQPEAVGHCSAPRS
jgi:hypothetical protein